MKPPKKIYRCVRSVFPDQIRYCEKKPDNKGFTDWVVKAEYVIAGSEKKATIRELRKWLNENKMTLLNEQLWVEWDALMVGLKEVGK